MGFLLVAVAIVLAVKGVIWCVKCFLAGQTYTSKEVKDLSEDHPDFGYTTDPDRGEEFFDPEERSRG